MKGLLAFLRGRKSRKEVWASALRRQTQRALREGRYAFALRYAQELTEVAPDDPEVWLIRGHLAWRHENDVALAVECFRKVLILGGYESSNACVAKARAYLAQILGPGL